jgi:hypothetical protein
MLLRNPEIKVNIALQMLRATQICVVFIRENSGFVTAFSVRSLLYF